MKSVPTSSSAALAVLAATALLGAALAQDARAGGAYGSRSGFQARIVTGDVHLSFSSGFQHRHGPRLLTRPSVGPTRLLTLPRAAPRTFVFIPGDRWYGRGFEHGGGFGHKAGHGDFGRKGFVHEGLDRKGFDRRGFDRRGFDRRGFDHKGSDRKGFGYDGFDHKGGGHKGGFQQYAGPSSRQGGSGGHRRH